MSKRRFARPWSFYRRIGYNANKRHRSVAVPQTIEHEQREDDDDDGEVCEYGTEIWDDDGDDTEFGETWDSERDRFIRPVDSDRVVVQMHSYHRLAYWHSLLAAICNKDPQIPHVYLSVLVGSLSFIYPNQIPSSSVICRFCKDLGSPYKNFKSKWRQIQYALGRRAPTTDQYCEWKYVIDENYRILIAAYTTLKHCRSGSYPFPTTSFFFAKLLRGIGEFLEPCRSKVCLTRSERTWNDMMCVIAQNPGWMCKEHVIWDASIWRENRYGF